MISVKWEEMMVTRGYYMISRNAGAYPKNVVKRGGP